MTKEILELDPESITTAPERMRSVFDPVAMKSLVKSIVEVGQMHPIIIDANGQLIVGERRLRACSIAEVKVLACRCNEADRFRLLQMELDENLCRDNLTPVEEICARRKLYDLLMEKNKAEESYGYREAARDMNMGKSQLQDDIKTSFIVVAEPSYFVECKTKAEIKQKVKKLLQQSAWATMTDTAMKQSEPLVAEPAPESGISTVRCADEDRENRIKLKIAKAIERLHVGEYMDGLATLDDESVNIMLLDLPWGIGIDDKINSGMLKGRSYDDSKETFLSVFPPIAELCYQKMAENSHLYCFFGIQHHNFVYTTLEDAGFQVNQRPIICHKLGISSTRVPEIWPGSSYEPIAFARKGQRKLVLQGRPDVLMVKWLTPDQKKQHPSAKPAEVYMELLSRSAHPGDLVVDPTYGTGAAFVACERLPGLNLRWEGWDNDKINQTKAMVNIIEYYDGIQQAVSRGEEDEP